jgi:hypothetical protein
MDQWMTMMTMMVSTGQEGIQTIGKSCWADSYTEEFGQFWARNRASKMLYTYRYLAVTTGVAASITLWLSLMIPRLGCWLDCFVIAVQEVFRGHVIAYPSSRGSGRHLTLLSLRSSPRARCLASYWRLSSTPKQLLLAPIGVWGGLDVLRDRKIWFILLLAFGVNASWIFIVIDAVELRW